MGFQNITGKQFRGLRTRDGKLIRNKVGAFERSRGCEEYRGSSRRHLLQAARDRDEQESTDAVFCAVAEPVCPLTGYNIPVGGGPVCEEVDTIDGGDQQLVMVVRYSGDGKVSSAHFVDLHDLERLS